MREIPSRRAARRRFAMLAPLAALAALSLASCSTMPRPDTDTAMQEPAVQVVVRNHHWMDVRVFALQGGQRHRIGTVTAALTHRLALPARMLESGRSVQLLAIPIGSRTSVATEMLRVHPGQRIEWTLESDLERSSVAVW